MMMYKCNFCKYTGNEDDLINHLQSLHKIPLIMTYKYYEIVNESHYCKLCGKRVLKTSHTSHINEYHAIDVICTSVYFTHCYEGGKLFKCDLCAYVFGKKERLLLHLKDSHQLSKVQTK